MSDFTGLGSIAAAGISYLGTQQTNAANAKQAALNRQFQYEQSRWAQDATLNNMTYSMDFQREMYGRELDASNSAYQRATADMQKAGINPMLAYMKGGATTPQGGGVTPGAAHPASGSLAHPMQNALGAAASTGFDAFMKLNSAAQMQEDTRKKSAEVGYVQDQAILAKATADRERSQSALNTAERLVALSRVANLDASTRRELGQLSVQLAEIGALGAQAGAAQAQRDHTRQDIDLIGRQGRNSAAGVFAHQLEAAGTGLGSTAGRLWDHLTNTWTQNRGRSPTPDQRDNSWLGNLFRNFARLEAFMFNRTARRRVYQPDDPTVVTKQAHKAECDIHNILSQYKRTGILTHISERQGEFIDLPDPLDFQGALETVQQAEDAFAALPSSVRDEFQNPAGFLAAFYDSTKEARLRELGLLNALPPAPAAPPSE